MKEVILLGGIGNDAHTVGLILLRNALQAEGYEVIYLGVQNRARDFVRHVGDADVVMVSCMDGHTSAYLEDIFPRKINAVLMRPDLLWYIGGNLATDGLDSLVKRLYALGFDRVFSHASHLRLVLDTLRADLSRQAKTRRNGSGHAVRPERRSCRTLAPGFLDRLLQERESWPQIREQVLQQYRTGRDVPRHFDPQKLGFEQQPVMAATLVNAKRQGQTLLQPRCGVQNLKEQVQLFQGLLHGGAGMLSLTIDSITRSNEFAKIDNILENPSRSELSVVLNGFPAVNHGLDGCRSVIRSVSLPVQIRHGSRDPRLLAETTLAAGATGYEGGMLCYTLPYFRDHRLEDAAVYWQYVDALCGRYAARGHVIDREYFGVLSATLIHPALAIVVNVLEALLSARQGVRSISVGLGEQGCRIQDVAAVREMETLTKEYLGREGYSNVFVSTAFNQYMAGFPEDEAIAADLIRESAVTGRLSGATRILVKTPVEATRIPSLEDNLTGLRLAREGLRAADSTPLDEDAVREEAAEIRQISKCILEAVLYDYNASKEIDERIIRAVRDGVIDIPFCPSMELAGNVLTARDRLGAVRFLECGNLPVPREICDDHRERIDRRARDLGMRPGLELIEYEVTSLPNGLVDYWPLDRHAHDVPLRASRLI